MAINNLFHLVIPFPSSLAATSLTIIFPLLLLHPFLLPHSPSSISTPSPSSLAATSLTIIFPLLLHPLLLPHSLLSIPTPSSLAATSLTIIYSHFLPYIPCCYLTHHHLFPLLLLHSLLLPHSPSSSHSFSFIPCCYLTHYHLFLLLHPLLLPHSPSSIPTPSPTSPAATPLTIIYSDYLSFIPCCYLTLLYPFSLPLLNPLLLLHSLSSSHHTPSPSYLP